MGWRDVLVPMLGISFSWILGALATGSWDGFLLFQSLPFFFLFSLFSTLFVGGVG